MAIVNSKHYLVLFESIHYPSLFSIKIRPFAMLYDCKGYRLYAPVILIALMVYLNSSNGDFVHDDIPAIVNNPDVNGKNIRWVQAFSNDFWGEPMASDRSHKSYRPLTILLFR